MGDTQLVVDGEDRTNLRPLRPAAPIDGPLAGSGAAPEPARRFPRPRRPWLRSATTPDADTPAPSAPAPAEPASTPAASSAPEPTTTESTPTAEQPGAPDGPAAAKPTAEAKPAGGTAAEAKPDEKPTAEARPSDGTAADARPGEKPTAGAKPSDGAAAEAKPADTAGTGDEPAAGTKPARAGKPDDGTGTAAKPGDGTATAMAAKPTDGTAADTKAGSAAAGAKTGDDTGAPSGAGDLAKTKTDLPATRPATGPRRRRVQFAHAVRRPPHRIAMTAARATREWSRRPSGRLTLPGVFLLALVAATAAAGALLVPATARGPRPVAVDATSAAPTTVPQGPLPGGTPLPGGSPWPGGSPLPGGTAPPLGTVPTGPPVGGSTGRPSDALAGWAAQVGPKVGISPVAVQAYGYAEVVLAQTNRSCGLSWTTLAAIGFVESGHGQANGARLGQDGKALPEIIGLPLDGNGGRMRIPDTDRGLLDKDPVLDRAIGPMQFIPTTWQEIGADADNDGVKDPHDLDDAALAAGNYLCKGSRNLTIPADWWNAILSYNDVRRYAQDVYDTANRYGQASRT
ncbi:lytic murein transglycosylase [Micromonospora sp. NPDC023644]|uniref:lytic murein transglycosylase n=1 Tax=Micromonospora sp. NPDC023644 TaxID=3154321 RepID=UPI0033E841C8